MHLMANISGGYYFIVVLVGKKVITKLMISLYPQVIGNDRVKLVFFNK